MLKLWLLISEIAMFHVNVIDKFEWLKCFNRIFNFTSSLWLQHSSVIFCKFDSKIDQVTSKTCVIQNCNQKAQQAQQYIHKAVMVLTFSWTWNENCFRLFMCCRVREMGVSGEQQMNIWCVLLSWSTCQCYLYSVCVCVCFTWQCGRDTKTLFDHHAQCNCVQTHMNVL